MRSFRHLPELGCCYPTPGHISAMLRYGFSFCLCQVQLVTFLAWKKNTPPNSRPRLIHLILALISAISTATHLKNNTFGDKLLRSRAFELDLLLVLISILSVCLSASGSGLRHICANLVPFSRALYRFRSKVDVSAACYDWEDTAPLKR